MLACNWLVSSVALADGGVWMPVLFSWKWFQVKCGKRMRLFIGQQRESIGVKSGIAMFDCVGSLCIYIFQRYFYQLHNFIGSKQWRLQRWRRHRHDIKAVIIAVLIWNMLGMGLSIASEKLPHEKDAETKTCCRDMFFLQCFDLLAKELRLESNHDGLGTGQTQGYVDQAWSQILVCWPHPETGISCVSYWIVQAIPVVQYWLCWKPAWFEACIDQQWATGSQTRQGRSVEVHGSHFGLLR